MKKRLILLATTAICVLLMIGMTACGEDQNAEQENESTTAAAEEPAEAQSSDDMSAKLIGAWMPADGLDSSAFSFGYMTDQGLSADPDSGEFCIQEKYVKYDGGGVTTVTSETDNGKIIYTSELSEYSAGGEIGKEGVVVVENITDHTAIINDAPYEKLTDDPADPEMIVNKTIDSRLASIVAGEWGTDDGAILLKLNDDGTMHYKNGSVDADGTWKSDGSMYITLDYTDPNTNEAGNDAYEYEVDNDWMSGTGENTDVITLLRK